MDKDCIFCKIAVGEIPCFKIYENKDFLAFLDINPWVEGHTLVIPKEHYQWVWDLPNPGEYFKVVSKIANHYKNVLGKEFVMGWIYGYEIPHAHFHLMPDARGKVAYYPKGPKKSLSKEEGEELVKKLSLQK